MGKSKPKPLGEPRPAQGSADADGGELLTPPAATVQSCHQVPDSPGTVWLLARLPAEQRNAEFQPEHLQAFRCHGDGYFGSR